jgi:hypothetical protein
VNKKYKCDVIGNRSIRLFDGKRVTYFEGDFCVIGNKRLVRVHFYNKKPKISMSKYICVVYSLPLNRRIRKDLIDIFINLAER